MTKCCKFKSKLQCMESRGAPREALAKMRRKIKQKCKQTTASGASNTTPEDEATGTSSTATGTSSTATDTASGASNTATGTSSTATDTASGASNGPIRSATIYTGADNDLFYNMLGIL